MTTRISVPRRGSWADLYTGTWAALSFWDALEHIDDPEAAIIPC